ncbi:MAG: hypothetical protein KKD44_21540 [Proteobacteria bacterium]|nr:hypothetical protein [Pseudomonadota bacterium]
MMIKKRFIEKIFFFIFIHSIFLMLSPSDFIYADEHSILYIRSDIKTVNGHEIEAKLMMLPAAMEEFRMSSFKRYKIHGVCSQDAKPDPLSAAKHNAFLDLLRLSGIKSIRNHSESRNAMIHDESILSFEGFIKTPYTILSQGFNRENQAFEIEIDVYFAPLAYPSKWSFHYFKKKLYDTLKNMVSVFL